MAQIKCKNCQKVYSEEFSYCPHCGFNRNAAVVSNGQNNPKKNNKKRNLIIGIVSLVVVAALTLFSIFYLAPLIKYNSAEQALKEENYDLAADIYKSLGNFRDSSAKLQLTEQIHNYDSAEKAFAEAKFKLAEEKYNNAGDYKDAAKKAKLSNQAAHYQAGQELFSLEKYQEAEKEFLSAGDYKDATEQAKKCHDAEYYEKALKLVEENKYQEALIELDKAKDSPEADKLKAEIYYSLAKAEYEKEHYIEAAEYFSQIIDFSDAKEHIIRAGKKLIDNKKYDDAIRVFSLLGTKDSAEYISYVHGKEALEKVEYEKAIEYLEKAASVFDAEELYKETNYSMGLTFFANEEYLPAQMNFEAAGDYRQAKDLVQVCKGEFALTLGRLNEAMHCYSQVSDDLDIGILDLEYRKNLFYKFSSFASLCGEWAATENYIETRNIYTVDGNWENWFIDDVLDDQYIQFRCFFEDDNTVTLFVTLSFYRYSDYSTDHSECLPKIVSTDFEITNLTSLPIEYQIDPFTTLSFADGAPVIDFVNEDYYSIYFYNIYTSHITFGQLVDSY